MAGSGDSYNTPFVVGSLKVSGQAKLAAGLQSEMTGYEVYLVE